MTSGTTLRIAALCILDEDDRLLLVRKRGTSRLQLPGGKLESGETAREAAVRETLEEIGLDIDETSVELLGRWTIEAANEPDTLIDADVFIAPRADAAALRALTPLAEIAELRLHPLGADDPEELAPLMHAHVMPALRARSTRYEGGV